MKPPYALLSLFIAGAIGLSSLSLRDREAVQSSRINLAANLPLTGDLATYGAAIQEGMLFALSREAASRTSLLTIDWQDNAGEPRQALSALRAQLRRKPNLYIAGVKPQYMAVKDSLARSGIPTFAWIFDLDLRDAGESVFRTWVNFKAETELFLRHIKERDPKRIAIVYVSLPSTDAQYRGVILPALEQSHRHELFVQEYQIDHLDFKTVALNIRSFNPDLIVLSGFQHNLIPLIRALRGLALIKDDNTIATYDLLDAAPLLSTAELEGIRVSVPKFLLSSDQKVIQWQTEFQAHFGKPPLYTHAYAFDMARILLDAAERLPEEPSKDEVIAALHATDIDGVTGPLRFDAAGDLLPNIELGVFRDGRLVRTP
ncbi:MAG: ABC transporter substrate-binding protein [Bdellovibrionales bacterium]|nr:ABC transporter substrate-binding protein [Bdellovibrionales bacterium]